MQAHTPGPRCNYFKHTLVSYYSLIILLISTFLKHSVLDLIGWKKKPQSLRRLIIVIVTFNQQGATGFIKYHKNVSYFCSFLTQPVSLLTRKLAKLCVHGC